MQESNGKSVSETVRVTFESGNAEETFERSLPVRYPGLWVTITTPEKSVAIHFLDTAKGLKRNIWEWDDDIDTSLRRVDMQFSGCDLAAAKHHHVTDAKPGMPDQQNERS